MPLPTDTSGGEQDLEKNLTADEAVAGSAETINSPSSVESGGVRARFRSFAAQAIKFGLIAGLVGGAVGVLAAAVISSFFATGPTSQEMSEKLAAIESQIANLVQRMITIEGDTSYLTIRDQIVEIDSRVEALNENIQTGSTRIGDAESSFSELKSEVDALSMSLGQLQGHFQTLEEVIQNNQRELEIFRIRLQSQPVELVEDNMEESQTTDHAVTSSSPAASTPDQGSVAFELARLEFEIEKLDTQLSNYQDIDNLLAGLTTQIRNLETRFDTQLEGIESGENEGDVSDIRDQSRQIMASMALMGIRVAIDVGMPYGRIVNIADGMELILPPIVIDHSATGVATLAELQQEFDDLVFKAIDAAPVNSNDGSFQGSVIELINSLVQVRRLTETEGDDANAVLSRIEGRLSDGDLVQVLELTEQLHPQVQEVLGRWQNKVEARNEIVSAVEQLLAEVERQDS